MEEPLVSVIMPSYNYDKWIEYSIRSILMQDYRRLELIIVDDCSSDSTHQIINEFMKNDQRIKYHKTSIHTNNIAKLLNIGIEIAKGDIIARQDADDISTNNRISSQLQFLIDNNIYICGTLFDVLLPNGDLLTERIKIQEIFTSCNGEFSPPLHGTWMMKNTLFNKVGMYDENFPYAQDFEYFYRIIFKHELEIRNIQRCLYKWRMHNSNVTFNKQRTTYISKAKESYSVYFDKLPSQHIRSYLL